jgi:hypothetical protein
MGISVSDYRLRNRQSMFAAGCTQSREEKVFFEGELRLEYRFTTFTSRYSTA